MFLLDHKISEELRYSPPIESLISVDVTNTHFFWKSAWEWQLVGKRLEIGSNFLPINFSQCPNVVFYSDYLFVFIIPTPFLRCYKMHLIHSTAESTVNNEMFIHDVKLRIAQLTEKGHNGTYKYVTFHFHLMYSVDLCQKQFCLIQIDSFFNIVIFVIPTMSLEEQEL